MAKSEPKSSKITAKGTQESKSRGLKIGGAIAGVIVLVAGGGTAVVVNNNRQIVVDAPPAVSQVAAPVVDAQSSLSDDVLSQQVTAIMDAAATNSDFGQLHATVSDASTGQTLWAKDDGVAAVPASSMKILTGAAALLGLGEDRRVTTTVQRVTGANDVVLRGAGDPTLSESGDGFFEDSASIADLAEQVSAAIPEGVGTVYVDYSLFSEVFHPAWEREGLADGYIAPVQSVMLDAGRVDPTDEDSQRSATPALDAGAALAEALGAKSGGSFADSGNAGNAGSAGADDAAGSTGSTVSTSSTSSSSESSTGTSSTETTAETTPSAPATPPPATDPTPIASVVSAPLITRIRDMMVYSDNVLAESIARELAIARGLPPTFVGAASAVRATLTEAGFSLDGAVLSDSSGLSTDNRITPQHLSQVLTAAAGPLTTGAEDQRSEREDSDEESEEDEAGNAASESVTGQLRPLLDCLPVAAVSGTLAERFNGTDGAGVVRAKTGTLNKASALAGYVVTRSGQVLTFVMISNEASLLPARAAADKTASLLAAI